MKGFLDELGKRLAEKWFSLLVLPGLLFLAAATVAVILGQKHWIDWTYLINHSRDLTQKLSKQPAVTIGLVAAAALLASAAIGITARALGSFTQRVWLGDWPGIFSRVADRRTRKLQERWKTCPDKSGKVQISLAEPNRATWMGNRIGAVSTRVEGAYRLHLTPAWPHLWLIMPETSRNELNSARTEFDVAATLTAWGVLYVLIGVRWWPAAIIGLVTVLAGWRRGRVSIDAYSSLTEATVDVYGPALAKTLGFGPGNVPLDPKTGGEITLWLRKGA